MIAQWKCQQPRWHEKAPNKMIANICWASLTHERGRLCARAGCSSQKWKQFFLHVEIFTHLPQKVFMEFVLRCFAIITFTCMTMFGGDVLCHLFYGCHWEGVGSSFETHFFLESSTTRLRFSGGFSFQLEPSSLWTCWKSFALRVGGEWITEHDWKFNWYRFEDNRNIGNFPTSHLSLLWMARYIEP